MLKSKNFYQVEKQKGQSINLAGLMYSEKESIAGWINRNEQIIKMKMPTTFDELEKYNEGHTLEWFHYLDVDVINAEIKHFITVLSYFLKKLK